MSREVFSQLYRKAQQAVLKPDIKTCCSWRSPLLPFYWIYSFNVNVWLAFCCQQFNLINPDFFASFSRQGKKVKLLLPHSRISNRFKMRIFSKLCFLNEILRANNASHNRIFWTLWHTHNQLTVYLLSE